ncbi:MAG: pilus assembly protein, partial [Erythrobacter sp.]|nr:pilus assembly protein [Erythrobacter sp.]
MSLAEFMRRLKVDTSGNALMLVAMGAPVLFGTAGLGVDMAQYYTWKREAQYAVDQSALAGAWARGNGDTGTEYETRASQEFYANLSVTKDYLLTHNVGLETWDGTADSSVMADATVSASLPFTELVLGDGMTIAVEAQAIWETTQQFTACLYSLDPTSTRTMWF